MEKPTIWSNRPDSMGRTMCLNDEIGRRARYGRIRPMPERKTLKNVLSRWMQLS